MIAIAQRWIEATHERMKSPIVTVLFLLFAVFFAHVGGMYAADHDLSGWVRCTALALLNTVFVTYRLFER